MIDPRKITPLLTGITVDRELGKGSRGTCYLVTRHPDGRKLVLKHIPIPSNDDQTKALIYAGAVKGEADAQRYYNTLVREIKDELLLLNSIQNASNLLKFRGYQVDQKIIGVGFDVYMLSDYCRALPEYLANHPLTRLQAVNLAIDMASGLEQLRTAGVVHKNIHPANVFLGSGHHFLLGDLGLVKLEDLDYSTMPDEQITEYTAPEVIPSDACLSDTMDIYSVGLILYEIYNGYSLPLDEEGRFTRSEEELPQPVYGDTALSEIILKACAYDPADRYQTPAELKQALTLHLQRNNVTDEPLFPVDDEVDAEVDVAAIAATVEAGQAAESGEAVPEDASEEVSESEESAVPEETPEVPAEPEAPKPSLNDLSADELMLPTTEEISVEDFLASIRSTPGLEVVAMEKDGTTSVVPGYETEATLPEDTEFVDSADTRSEPPAYDSGDELPEPHTPMDFSGILEPEDAPADSYAYDHGEEYSTEPAPVSNPRRSQEPETIDDGYEEDEDYEEDGRSGGWKAALIAVIVLLVLAGGAFALYTFKTDTVQDIRSQVLSSSSVQITANSKNQSAMEVVCSTPTGEISRMPLTADGAVFTDLNPSSTYTFTLQSQEGKWLLGSRSVEAKTAQMTNLTNFTASSISATSASFAVAGTGAQPEQWVITCQGATGEPVSATASDVSKPVTVEGLTPATEYTATITRGDGDQLSGTTTCTFTTMEYTELSSFEVSDISTESVTVQWEFSGTRPETWSVTCTGDDGTSTTQEVGGTECSMDGLTSGVSYTITLTCDSLKETELNTLEVGIPNVTVTEISSIQDDNGNIVVNWEYSGDIDPDHWSVTYQYASTGGVTPTQVTADTNSVTLENVVPEVEYIITVETADDLRVGGMTESHIVTEAAEEFTKFGATDAELTLYAMEENPDGLEIETETFTTTQHIAFAVQASYDATDEDKHVKTLYVIRGDDGVPVYVYRNDDPGRSWSGSWTTARHTGDGLDVPKKPGAYSLEVYFDGDLLASKDFTVIAE